MGQSDPWDIDWQYLEKIGGGGQGSTALVKNRSTQLVAVLKTLTHNEDSSARSRMLSEVDNLKILHKAGCRVPAVLDSNVDKFENSDQLYFVMDRIEGVTLFDFMATRAKLPLQMALNFCLNLCETTQLALKYAILHRDIKPKNIIVENEQKSMLIIVDYGLSFNSALDNDLTRQTETIENGFLTLPERRMIGGLKRDLRSDLTGIVGILYYLLTGKYPEVLVDDKGLFPHKRHLIELSEGKGATANINSFFDRGFKLEINSRYQTVDELISRITELKNTDMDTSFEDPKSIISDFSKVFYKSERKVQLETFNDNASLIINSIYNKLNKWSLEIMKTEHKPFKMSIEKDDTRLKKKLPPGDLLYSTSCAIHLRLRGPTTAKGVAFCICAIEEEATLYRVFFLFSTERGNIIINISEDWHPLIRYPANAKPEIDSVLDLEVNQCISRLLSSIRDEYLLPK